LCAASTPRDRGFLLLADEEALLAFRHLRHVFYGENAIALRADWTGCLIWINR